MKIQSLLIGVILIFLNWGCSSNGQNNKEKFLEKKVIKEEETLPFFAVTGFGINEENISFEDLKTKYCKGEVYVLKTLKSKVDKLMSCENSKTLEKLSDFRVLAKENILITDLANLTSQFKALSIDKVNFFRNPKDYVFIPSEEDKKPFDSKNNITKFMLTGVTAITRNTGISADKNGTAFLIESVKQYFQDSDFVHISNEVSFTDDCDYTKPQPGYIFCSKERDFQCLIDLNTNIVELTGNHNVDFGKESYTKTFNWYKENNMQTFGGGLSPEEANKPLIITLKDGKKMAFIGFNEKCPVNECADKKGKVGANRYDKVKAQKVINDLKQTQKIDLVFASVQFAEVDSYYPSQTQAKITRDLVDFGADVVYGSQAHQVQKIEFHKGKPIFHGLGNFLFDQIHRIGVKQGYFLENYIYKGKLVQSIPIFTMITTGRRPEIATEKEEKVIRNIVFEDKYLYK